MEQKSNLDKTNEQKKKQEVSVVSKVSELLKEQLVKVAKALPPNFNTDRFILNCQYVIREKEFDFQKCKLADVISTLLIGAKMDLDFFEKECYAIAYNGVVTFQTDYKGEVKICKKYSSRPIKDLYAQVARKGDFLDAWVTDGQQHLSFKPLMFNNEEIVGAFAVVLYEDGGMSYEVMSAQEIDEIRGNFSKQKSGDIWRKSPGEMSRKTVLRRLSKHIDKNYPTPEMAQLFEETSPFEMEKPKVEKQVPPEPISYVDVTVLNEPEEINETNS